jgi:hypothetical protein
MASEDQTIMSKHSSLPSPSSPYSPSYRKSFEMRSGTWHSPSSESSKSVRRVTQQWKLTSSSHGDIGAWMLILFPPRFSTSVKRPAKQLCEDISCHSAVSLKAAWGPIYLDYERDSLWLMNYLALQCPLLKKLVTEIPDLNRGPWLWSNFGLIKEMTYIIQQLVKAWKERLRTEDDKKLPFLWFSSGVHVERC